MRLCSFKSIPCVLRLSKNTCTQCLKENRFYHNGWQFSGVRNIGENQNVCDHGNFMCVNAGACRGQKRASDSLELTSMAVVSSLR